MRPHAMTPVPVQAPPSFPVNQRPLKYMMKAIKIGTLNTSQGTRRIGLEFFQAAKETEIEIAITTTAPSKIPITDASWSLFPLNHQKNQVNVKKVTYFKSTLKSRPLPSWKFRLEMAIIAIRSKVIPANCNNFK